VHFILLFIIIIIINLRIKIHCFIHVFIFVTALLIIFIFIDVEYVSKWGKWNGPKKSIWENEAKNQELKKYDLCV
jgi:hypothetical protein